MLHTWLILYNLSRSVRKNFKLSLKIRPLTPQMGNRREWRLKLAQRRLRLCQLLKW